MASTIKVNNIQNQCGANIVNKCSTTITLGASGDNITLAAGATQSGFGRTGTVNWDTTAKTANFTAVSGNGYFVNTTSGSITVTLPAGSAGDIVSLADYAGTWQTNAVTVTPNGTDKIGGVNVSVTLNTEGQSVTFVYTDSTQGWLNTMDSTSNVRGSPFIAATGGTITTCGDYKIHAFTGPGTFTVTNAGAGTPCAPANVDYLVVAGGGGGGQSVSGGNGGGGFRVSSLTYSCGSPLASPTGLPVSVTAYPITVGAGGSQPAGSGDPGSNSVFSTITSTGGGSARDFGGAGTSGGSGAGNSAVNTNPGGAGNTPPVSPPQGQPGGSGGPDHGGGGGGGAGAAGTNGAASGSAAPGGNGSYIPNSALGPTAPSYGTTGPVGSTRYFAGGGGGGFRNPGVSPNPGNGGAGGGGYARCQANGTPGSTNTGGGGGGGMYHNPTGGNYQGGAGGSGIVIIRYKYQ